MALEELIEGERESAQNYKVEDKKAKEDQELARFIRQEAEETFADTRRTKLDENEKDTEPSEGKKSRSYGSETLTLKKISEEKQS